MEKRIKDGQNANEFFSKMGLIDIPKSLWNNSIFEQLGDGKNISCDATSWDFYDGKVLFLISFKILVLDELKSYIFILGKNLKPHIIILG